MTKRPWSMLGSAVGLGLIITVGSGCGGAPGSASPNTTTLPAGGGWSLTVKTDPSCSPQVTRTWSATITQSGSTAAVTVPAVNLTLTCGLGQGGSQNMMLCPASNGGPAGPLAIVDPVDNLHITSNSSVELNVSGHTISGRFDGQFGTCNSLNHTITFTNQ
jgi:hypothetical protein